MKFFLEILDQYTFSEKYKIEPVSTNSGSPNDTLSEKERIQKMIPKSRTRIFEQRRNQST